jgi:hypothetical protein
MYDKKIIRKELCADNVFSYLQKVIQKPIYAKIRNFFLLLFENINSYLGHLALCQKQESKMANWNLSGATFLLLSALENNCNDYMSRFV